MDQVLLQRQVPGAAATCSPRGPEPRCFRPSFVAARPAKRQRVDHLVSHARGPARDKSERAKFASPSIDPTLERPWADVLPSLDDLAREGWELKVKDWPAFWEMVQRWFEYESDTSTPDWEAHSETATVAQLQYQDPDHTELLTARREYYENWFQIRDRDQVNVAELKQVIGCTLVPADSYFCRFVSIADTRASCPLCASRWPEVPI